MTTTIKLNLKENAYPIVIGHDILKDMPRHLKGLSLGKDAVIISHPMIEKLYGNKLSAALKKVGYSVKVFNVPEGEQSKSASCALRLIESIAAYDVNRNLFVIALGGGVVGDLAGFVAAIYKRGIPYIQVPTTLLAQIDSSIGGKTAIDLKYGKNLVGAFYQPKAVIADTKVLSTLSDRQVCNGLAEAIKYGVIKDPVLFRFLEDNYKKIFKHDSKSLIFMVRCCAQIKADVVAADEKETKGIRTILNYGHTAGHAIEAAGNFRYHHGEAVGLGMRVAGRIAVSQGLLSEKDEQRINDLITAVGLPEKTVRIKISSIMNLMLHDKKFVAGRNRFVLSTKIGQVKVVENIPLETINSAVQSTF
ncbi:MAG: 3-dehydroquinate synthase [Candidatus Omnitrophica bacterium]|nr:3-dehydroquinate synthase [Candidatus Omnitrophota bacterium]